ncbi:MAG TPA: SDR family NAD(P)-dependent oxidoreductase [Hyphomicrobiaceae bacterium]|jgi:NAD(P)-dependent dehydrogenase (short-subunit alcohol dehydrogenase family)|nr:SDR family NAD(P)-dependent oxidoreductase [Hyphomicrobiaceae bacterium]
MAKTALIVGAGSGISAAFARALNADDYRLCLAARDIDKLAALAQQTSARLVQVDAADAGSVAALFAELDRHFARLDVVLYNASYRARGALLDLDPGEVKKSIEVSAYGGFLVAQQAARRMLAEGEGAIFFTGASASVKGYAQSAPFAMGKFALRGLAQAMARELQPLGIHVAHFVIDGGVRNAARGRPDDPARPDGLLDPEAVAHTYMAVLKQPRNAWSLEVELRPWLERF